MKSVSFVLLLFFSFGYSTCVYGQCCAAGNPACGDGGSESIGMNELMVSIDYNHSLSRDYYHGAAKFPISYMQNSYYNFSKINLTYGLHPRFTLGAELGYFFDKTQNLNLLDGEQKIQSHGLGDLGVFIRANLLKKLFLNPNKLVLSVGGIIPIGAFNEEINNVVIPVSLQPSSGTFKYNVRIYFVHKKKESKYGWDARSFFEYRSTIEKGFLYHQYGPMLDLEAGIIYSNAKKLSLKLKGKVAYHFQDFRENNILIESSGGIFTSISPIIYYKPNATWGVLAALDIPLYRNVKGYQLTQLYGFRISISKKIKLEREINEH